MHNKIRLSKSTISSREKEAVLKVLDAEFLGMGEEVKNFEAELQAFLQTDRSVICVNTGTSALHLAVEALDLKDAEVLVPSITYVASYAAISAAGAIPVSCDVDEDSLFMDLNDAKNRLSSRTKAIMPVHYSGDASRMNAVYAFAQQHGLRVIEDAAHSFGSTLDGQKVGAIGDIVCFSFDGIKNITAGEGGAIVTGDLQVAERLKDSRLLGVIKDTEQRFSGKRSWDFDVTRQGYRYHMSNIMAAIGRTQLSNMQHVETTKRRLVQNYLRLLEGIPKVETLSLNYDNMVAHIFVIKAQRRDELKAYLEALNIECGIHYKPNHLLSLYRSTHALPTAERLYNEILTLPLHLDLQEEEQLFIADNIQKFYND